MSINGLPIGLGAQNPKPKPLKLWEKCVGGLMLCVAAPCVGLWFWLRSLSDEGKFMLATVVIWLALYSAVFIGVVVR